MCQPRQQQVVWGCWSTPASLQDPRGQLCPPQSLSPQHSQHRALCSSASKDQPNNTLLFIGQLYISRPTDAQAAMFGLSLSYLWKPAFSTSITTAVKRKKKKAASRALTIQTLLSTLLINKDFSCWVTIAQRKTCRHRLVRGKKISVRDKRGGGQPGST